MTITKTKLEAHENLTDNSSEEKCIQMKNRRLEQTDRAGGSQDRARFQTRASNAYHNHFNMLSEDSHTFRSNSKSKIKIDRVWGSSGRSSRRGGASSDFFSGKKQILASAQPNFDRRYKHHFSEYGQFPAMRRSLG